MKDPVAKAAYDKARRARLRVDRRPTACKGCGVPIVQAVTSVRLYCNDRCKGRTFRTEHFLPVVSEPIPMPYVGDAIFVQARTAAGIAGDYASDWGQYDLISEAVLAIVEGRDPNDAVRRWRGAEKATERHRVRGIADIGTDGRRVVVQWDEVA